MSTDRRTRSWIEVDAAALRRNLHTLSSAVGPAVRLIPMVKADAYGVGVAGAVHILEECDPWAYGVATIDEGRELRDLGVSRPVLIFSPLHPDSYGELVESGLTPCLSDLDGLGHLARVAARSGCRSSFHAEVDTGMGRSGFDWRRAGEWWPGLRDSADQGLQWTGCFTHFHSADLADTKSVEQQWGRLQALLAEHPAPQDGFMVHAANSAAALRTPAWAAQGVRPGIFLYGGVAGHLLPAPEPVVSLKAAVILVKDVQGGSTLGYGATYRSKGRERWATLGIGYGDGLPRSLANRGAALLRGARVPIVGRISMDLTVVDISGVDGVEVGDPAILIGSQGGEAISLEEVADLAGTTNYDVLTGLGSRIPRIWLDGGGP